MQKGLRLFFCNFSFLMIVKYRQFYLIRPLKTIVIQQYAKETPRWWNCSQIKQYAAFDKWSGIDIKLLWKVTSQKVVNRLALYILQATWEKVEEPKLN